MAAARRPAPARGRGPRGGSSGRAANREGPLPAAPNIADAHILWFLAAPTRGRHALICSYVPIKQHLGRGGGCNGVSHHFAPAHGVGGHHFDHSQGVGWLSLSWTKAMISQSLHNHFLCEFFCCKRQFFLRGCELLAIASVRPHEALCEHVTTSFMSL